MDEYFSEVGKDLDGRQLKIFNALKKQGLGALQAIEFAKSNEKYLRYIELTSKENPLKLQRPLSPKEASECIFSKVAIYRIEAYLEFLNNGIDPFTPCAIPEDDVEIKRMFELCISNRKKKFSRPLDFNEAKCAAATGLDDAQVQRFIDIIEKYKKENSKPPIYIIKEFVLSDRNDEEIRKHVKLAKAGVAYDIIKEFIEDEEKYKRFNEIYLLNQKSFFSRKLNDFEIGKMAQALVEIRQVENCITISKRNPMMCIYAAEIGSNDKYFEKYKDLTKDENSKNYKFQRRLTNEELFYAITGRLNDVQIEQFIKLCNEGVLPSAAHLIAKDEKLYQRYQDLKCGKTPLATHLNQRETAAVFEKNYSDSFIQSYAIFKKALYSEDLLFNLTEDFTPYMGKIAVEELQNEEKEDLLKKLIKYNSKLFNQNCPKNFFPLLPKDREEYCEILSSLSSTIEGYTLKLNRDENREFFEGLNSLINGIKNADIDKMQLSLSYSAKDFVSDVLLSASHFKTGVKSRAFDYFDFKIENGKLEGYPILKENTNFSEEEINEAIKAIRPFVEKYHIQNRINCSDKQIEDGLNKIIKGFFEFKSEINKKQHSTHKYTLDKHSLKVLQNVVLSQEFENLNDSDKRALVIASILHDISKKEDTIDKIHPIKSAIKASKMIKRLDLTKEEQLKIYELIKTHDWLEKINTSTNRDKTIKDIAFETRFSNTFSLAKILCKADLKSVNDSFYDYFKEEFEQTSMEVDSCIEQIKRTRVFLPQSKIPPASKIKNAEILNADGITNTVLYLDKIDNDLTKYGFQDGTTKENLYLLAHALSSDEQIKNLNLFNSIDNETLLSASYITPDFHPTYKKNGLILDIHPIDIHTAYYKDIHSGYTKSLRTLKDRYLFPSGEDSKRNAARFRRYIPDLIRQKTGLSEDEYSKILDSFEDKTSMPEIKKINKNFQKGLIEAFKEMFTATSKSGTYSWSEVLISRPNIQAAFSMEEDFGKIPLFLRKYAQENDLLIIIYGKNK